MKIKIGGTTMKNVLNGDRTTAAWRVTGFNGATSEEFNLGVFLAVDRFDAIAQARRAGRGADLVLDAYTVKQ